MKCCLSSTFNHVLPSNSVSSENVCNEETPEFVGLNFHFQSIVPRPPRARTAETYSDFESKLGPIESRPPTLSLGTQQRRLLGRGKLVFFFLHSGWFSLTTITTSVGRDVQLSSHKYFIFRHFQKEIGHLNKYNVYFIFNCKSYPYKCSITGLFYIFLYSRI